ncbi:sulfatase [Synechococcus sp. CC9616]|uniref:sulfatase family protein n=1 Tax=Synechococcus sp. CC9616 TaxID=110663 RepID=UPI0004B234F3|nr:sulfatase-like hydrolase/transferase [Synechococcus sp. CC9616]
MGNPTGNNLLIISFDQWRGDWGNPLKPVIKLPTYEKIAENGIILTRCYTNSPQCVPARFSWITGLEPSQTCITKNEDVSLPSDAPSIIRDLQKNGWYTSIVGKTHWSSHNKPRDIRVTKRLIHQLGFDDVLEIPGPRALRTIDCKITDHWKEEGYLEMQRKDLYRRYCGIEKALAWKRNETILPNYLYPDIWLANQAVEKIEKLPERSPWLLWVSFVGPHEPFDTPHPWRGINKSNNLPAVIEKRLWINALNHECQLKESEQKWKDLLTKQDIKELREDYADHLCLLDEQINKLINTLNKRPDSDNTTILVMSDHGEMLGDGNMLYKGTFLESSIRVPFILKQANSNKRSIQIKKPINLTGAFKSIILGLQKNNPSKSLRVYCRKRQNVVVEYNKERLYIHGNRKICTNSHGNILWATNIKKDPNEEINIAKSQKFQNNKKWHIIQEKAKKEDLKRARPEWIWRDLLKNSYDQI